MSCSFGCPAFQPAECPVPMGRLHSGQLNVLFLWKRLSNSGEPLLQVFIYTSHPLELSKCELSKCVFVFFVFCFLPSKHISNTVAFRKPVIVGNTLSDLLNSVND